MKKKGLALIAASALLVVGVVAGSLAWLTDFTKEVKNTFTPADIGVTLTETWNAKSDDEKEENDIWKAQMIPGYSYTKDPKVEVSADSVDCYLFVKFEESGVSTTVDKVTVNYLLYTSTLTAANGWTQGDGTNIPANVWYRKVMASDTTRSWELLSGNTITVNGDVVTKENMSEAAQATLTYTAYASQLYKTQGTEFTAKEAWDNVPKA